MGVELTVLGSGSAGNATLLSYADTNVLIDVGLSCREVSRRLEGLSVDPDSISAIMITHAHGDHTRGARVFARRHDVPVYMTSGVRNEWGVTDIPTVYSLTPNTIFDLSGLRFLPFEIPHDASETVGFRILTPEGIIGYATDIGVMTPDLIESFRDCNVLVVESNHATELLRVSPYAQSTRERIAGDSGHLSNEALAAFIQSYLGPNVRCVVLAHLSRVNNVPELADVSCREALAACGRTDVEVVITSQDFPAKTIDLGAWLPTMPTVAGAIRQTALPFH
jgi:phosphoribosyl 1,2-cyclic phosphodiesterase